MTITYKWNADKQDRLWIKKAPVRGRKDAHVYICYLKNGMVDDIKIILDVFMTKQG